MILGMLSWTMATIQDYRSGFQKKKTATSPETSENVQNMYTICIWTLNMFSWSITCRVFVSME